MDNKPDPILDESIDDCIRQMRACQNVHNYAGVWASCRQLVQHIDERLKTRSAETIRYGFDIAKSHYCQRPDMTLEELRANRDLFAKYIGRQVADGRTPDAEQLAAFRRFDQAVNDASRE